MSVKYRSFSLFSIYRVEAQRDQQMNVAWNMEQSKWDSVKRGRNGAVRLGSLKSWLVANMAIDNVKGAIVQVDTMKQANVALKSQVKKINLDQIDVN